MAFGVNGNVPHLNSTYNVLNKINENAYGIIELKKDINGNDYGEFRALTIKERIWNFFFGIDTGMTKFFILFVLQQVKPISTIFSATNSNQEQI